MNRFCCFCLAVWMMTAALPSLAQQGPVRIVGLVELSGTGATSGTNFDNGVKLAVKEINAGGGILGRKVEYTSSDTQSAPQTAKALAQKAVDEGAYVESVGSGTPAAKAGLQVGDVVVRINDTPVTSAASLGGVIRKYVPGDQVELTIDRDGDTRTLTAVLGEAPTS